VNLTPRQETWLVVFLSVFGAVLWFDSINEWVFTANWTRATYATLSIIIGVNRIFRARWNWSRSRAASVANVTTAFYSFVIAWVFYSFTELSFFHPFHDGGISQLDGARWLRGPLILQIGFLSLGFWLEHKYEKRVGQRFVAIIEEECIECDDGELCNLHGS